MNKLPVVKQLERMEKAGREYQHITQKLLELTNKIRRARGECPFHTEGECITYINQNFRQ